MNWVDTKYRIYTNPTVHAVDRYKNEIAEQYSAIEDDEEINIMSVYLPLTEKDSLQNDWLFQTQLILT
ncbi:hypothetical protein [Pseudoalteromonas piscicida]|uniref:hypothetical protein n=1 Tax=Pseudoalteromonas piscicida TaxID=43662 RepID=UPI000C166215|nr:hypothetical protein [Pseudoalteromonas piscicida]